MRAAERLRHGEERSDEAIQTAAPPTARLDGFAALAMTSGALEMRPPVPHPQPPS